MAERTLSIIKPDATARSLEGEILAMIQQSGLKVIACKRLHLTPEQAGGFYEVHRERPFYKDLCDFMSSGPILVSVLEGEGAIAAYRELMGATNPDNAEDGTIRKKFAENIERNSVHGSDAPETAAFEIGYFFNNLEIVG